MGFLSSQNPAGPGRFSRRASVPLIAGTKKPAKGRFGGVIVLLLRGWRCLLSLREVELLEHLDPLDKVRQR